MKINIGFPIKTPSKKLLDIQLQRFSSTRKPAFQIRCEQNRWARTRGLSNAWSRVTPARRIAIAKLVRQVSK